MRPRLLFIVTHARSAGLLRGQLGAMKAAGFQVGFASSPGPTLRELGEREGVEVFPVPMSREIDPLADLKALAHMVRVMREWRPDVVNAGTPKAGLLGMVAAWITRVPARVYVLRGLRLETMGGVKRHVLRMTERIASACANKVVAVSHSLAERYVAFGLTSAEKVCVMGSGSSNGVRSDLFASTNQATVAALRERLPLPAGSPVVGFVGRFTRDKGVGELVQAFERVLSQVPEARLLLVGDFEAGDPVPEAVVERIRSHSHIVLAGRVPDVAPYYELMDVLAFPSHREGFPNVPLEAAAAGLPVVGARATGTVDAVVDGVTGMLVDIGDTEGLTSALIKYLTSGSLRDSHGEAGRRRAREEFPPERIWAALLAEYDRLLVEAGRPSPAVSRAALVESDRS